MSTTKIFRNTNIYTAINIIQKYFATEQKEDDKYKQNGKYLQLNLNVIKATYKEHIHDIRLYKKNLKYGNTS
jgi:hypothetical protein